MNDFRYNIYKQNIYDERQNKITYNFFDPAPKGNDSMVLFKYQDVSILTRLYLYF